MRKEPTHTSLVEEVLRRTDDFMSVPQLMAATGSNSGQITAALFSLRVFRVVDVIIQPDGIGWWYTLPKELDTRQHHYDPRQPELKPRRDRTGHYRRKEKL